MNDTNLCPCGSGTEVTTCCLPYIQGDKQPSTALDLLKARYTAFARGEVDYVLSTHHSRTRNEVKREEIEDWSKNSEWLGLKVVEVQAGQASDEKGTIIFGAHYRAENKNQEHWEKSFFEKENGNWRFLDAQGVQVGTYRRPEPQNGKKRLMPLWEWEEI